MQQVDVSIGVVRRGPRLLITRRPSGGSFPGYWEFPGGKRESGETLEQCLHRELREEIGLSVTDLVALEPVEHVYPAAVVRLYPFLCRSETGEPKLIAVEEARWIFPDQLRDFQFPPANQTLLERVICAF